MADRDLLGIATTAKIAAHPVHPMLVPFPIALLTATLVCDLIFWANGNGFWAQAAFWTLTGAIITALIAAVAGFADFLSNARIRALSDAWHHMLGNLFVVVLAVVNLWLRYTGDVAQSVIPWGLTLSVVIMAVLIYTGWKGGEPVYRWRVGMQPEEPIE